MSADRRASALKHIKMAESYLSVVQGDVTIKNYLRLAREQIEVEDTFDEAKSLGINVTWISQRVEKILPLPAIRKLIAAAKELKEK